MNGMRLFGTAGMRGVTGVDMTPSLFHRVARAATAVLGGPGRDLAVGRDTRPGAAMLSSSAMAGAMEGGARVHDDAGELDQTQRVSSLLAHHQQRRSAVVDRRGVGSRHRLAKTRPQRRPALRGPPENLIGLSSARKQQAEHKRSACSPSR